MSPGWEKEENRLRPRSEEKQKYYQHLPFVLVKSDWTKGTLLAQLKT